MKKATTTTKPATKKLPAVMLVSVPPKVLEAFKKKVNKELGFRKMSPLIVSWMVEFIEGKKNA